MVIGSRRLMQERSIATDALEAEAQRLEAAGLSVMWVGELVEPARLLGVVAVGDHVREGSARAIAKLVRRRVRVVMLTGDNARSASAIAEVLPADKAQAVQELRAQGDVVAMEVHPCVQRRHGEDRLPLVRGMPS